MSAYQPPQIIKFLSDDNVLELVEVQKKNTKNKWKEDRYLYKYTHSSTKKDSTVPITETHLKKLVNNDLVTTK